MSLSDMKNRFNKNSQKMQEESDSTLQKDEEEIITGDINYPISQDQIKKEGSDDDDEPEQIEQITIEDDDEPVFIKREPAQNNWLSSVYQNGTLKQFTSCPACQAVFLSHHKLQIHLMDHATKKEDRIICSYCNFSTENLKTFFTHLPKHANQCETCNVHTGRRIVFDTHLKIAKKDFTVKRDHFKNFLCISCHLSFDYMHQLRKHWFRHTCKDKKISQCGSCSAVFDSAQDLDNHKCLQCPVCFKIYSNFPALRCHTRYKKHFLFCSTCNYEFSLRVDHDRHMALHRKAFKPHKKLMFCLQAEDRSILKCKICGKLWQTNISFVSHVHDDHKLNVTNYKRHAIFSYCLQSEDESNLQCELCGKIFVSDTRFICHVYNEHGINVTVPEICENNNPQDEITFEDIKVEIT